MKVAFFAGHSNSILLFNSELVLEMVKKGHEVVCMGPEIEYKDEFEKLGAKFTQIEFNRHSINPTKGLAIIKNLTKMFKKESFDVYYGFTAVPATYGVIAAKKAGIKNIYIGVTGAGKIVQKRKGVFNHFIRIILSCLYKYSIRKCTKVFFLNDDNINYFIKHNIVKSSQCVKTNGSGVNTEKYPFVAMPQKHSFLYVGVLVKFKGIIEYMEAARLVKKEYPQAEFHIVGGLSDRVSAITKQELDEYISDGSVIFHDFQKNVQPFIADCRYFVLPSYSEGVPTSVLEAMSTGRPIITTYAPGCRETVIEQKNGFLVPIKDIEALKEKMIYIIENPSEAEEMAKNSRMLAEDHFNVEIVNSVMMKTMGL